MRPSAIVQVGARQIFDSRARPTVEADVVLADGSRGRASTPSGSSTGRHEAHELRDGDPNAYGGLGVSRAVHHVRTEIAAQLYGLDALEQASVDRRLLELDGTPSLRRLGANAVLATSLACARAAAVHLRLPLYRYLAQLAGDPPISLPLPMTNLLSGGGERGRGMDFQDFVLLPLGAASYSEALASIWSVRAATADLLRRMNLPVLCADDGGFSPGFARAEQALELMVRAIEASGQRPGRDLALGIDLAASELFEAGRYHLACEHRQLSSRELHGYVADLTRRFPIASIEDVLDQDDWDAWCDFTRETPDLQIVGDDLFATQLARVERGIATKAANAALIKLNQNGTLTGTLGVIATLRAAGLGTVLAGRSGDTEDSFIADLAVGAGIGQIKVGALQNMERLGKYNQLLRIEEESGAPFAQPRLALVRS
ncbi:MAG: enolase [Myxococcaceae bacterium]|nr:enolase [Myxococcaceae bacterium]